MLSLRTIIFFTLVAVIAADFFFIAITLARYPLYFSQPGSRNSLATAAFVLLSYAAGAAWFLHRASSLSDGSFKIAAVFGLIGAFCEIVNISIENFAPVVNPPAVVISFMFLIFV